MSLKKDRDYLIADIVLDCIVIILCIIALILSILILIHMDKAIPEIEPEVETMEFTTVIPEITHDLSIPETTETIPEKTDPTEAPTESGPTPEEILYDKQLFWLTCVIYQEAGGDNNCDDCRRRIADIVLNRMAHPDFPDTMDGVLTQEGQYGQMHYTGVVMPARAKDPYEKPAVDRAAKIAAEVLSGAHSDVYGEGYIWQAGFKQGRDGFWCCNHWYGR